MVILKDILINIVLLFGLVFIISLTNSRIKLKNKYYDVLFGIIIGFITIFIMQNAWQMTKGAFFDTRSVMIGATALFFSPFTSIVAAIIPMIYRINIGGPGIYAGTLSIFFALISGLVWKKYISPKLKVNQYFNFYLFGVLIHVFVVLSQLTFPYPQNIEVLKNVGLILIIFFPVATMLLCLAIVNHEKRISYNILIEKSEKKYRSLISNSKLGIIQYNKDCQIEIANDSIAHITGIKRERLIGLNLKELNNEEIIMKVKQSLQGLITTYEGYYQSKLSERYFPTRIQLSPIFEGEEVVGGVGIIEDLSSEYENQKHIKELMQLDILTKLFNRQTFDQFILLPIDESLYPISIATLDINTFQVINTSFGYDVGNLVLIEIGRVMTDQLKPYPNAKIYRIGGDEFAIIFINTDKDTAISLTEKVKDQIGLIDDFDFSINMSYGLETIFDQSLSLPDAYNQALINMNSNKIYDGSSISIKTIDVIMATLFEKSKREKMHSERVSQIAKDIAKNYSLGTAFTNRVELAGRLHDIGKINISEEILDKPGRLDDSERRKINKHPEAGYKILASVSEYLDIANIVLSHHERYDGLGYPRGVKGHNIPLESRIIAVADAYDAMTELRTYRVPLSEEEAIEELMKHKGTQFDPEVVNIFLKIKTNSE